MSVLVPFIFWSKNCEYGYEYGVSERFERALMVCCEGGRERDIFNFSTHGNVEGMEVGFACTNGTETVQVGVYACIHSILRLQDIRHGSR